MLLQERGRRVEPINRLGRGRLRRSRVHSKLRLKCQLLPVREVLLLQMPHCPRGVCSILWMKAGKEGPLGEERRQRILDMWAAFRAEQLQLQKVL